MNEKIGIFYGSTTCYTEIAAEKICGEINSLMNSKNTSLYNVSSTSVSKMNDYKYLILGIPTWDFGELQEDWENQWEALSELNLESKYVAIFGLGDQVGYPEWFQDAMGYLWQKIKNQYLKKLMKSSTTDLRKKRDNTVLLLKVWIEPLQYSTV